VLEFLAYEMKQARTAAAVFKQNLLHIGCPRRLSTGGNLAFAFTTNDCVAHESYHFVLHHLIDNVESRRVINMAVHDWSWQGESA